MKDTKGFKETVALKAQREDITIINNSLVNYATKADLDNVYEKLGGQTKADEFNQIKMMTEQLRESLKS